MSKISNMFPSVNRLVVNGTFQCMVCYTQDDEAWYFPNSRMLIWNCSECGVANELKDISL